MSETFVPLVAAPSAARSANFASLNLKTPAVPSTPLKVSAETSAGAAASTCGKPTVTLQRTGDIVSSIRVQCGCGQVVDLSCVY